MDPTTQFTTVAVWLLPLGGLSLALLAWRGCLAPGALRAGPDRDIGLKFTDLLVAIGLSLTGSSALPLVLGAISVAYPDVTGPISDLPTLAQAGLVLLGQLMGQGPPAAYLFLRAWFAPQGLVKVGFVSRRPARDAAYGAVGLVATLPIVLGVMLLMTGVGHLVGRPAPEIAHDLLQTLRASDSVLGTVLLGVAAVMVAPVLEEIVFRGVLQTVLLRSLGTDRRWWVVLMAAALFMLVHAGPGTFNPEAVGGVPWHALPALFVLGVVFGWLYEKTGSLWPSILAHAGFNLFNAALVVATGAGG